MILVEKATVNRKSGRGHYGNGLTINNLYKFVIRYLEAQALSEPKPNADKAVTNPTSLKRSVGRGFSLAIIERRQT